ncbi:DUF2069 domain-containing protein [Marinobacterium sediminicola]|uniref:Uncharacterized membrane protein n=1 Tax=Marinobacterium sediminicola TaxID=518898 RepID=A0ABY1RW45_9GAMM|nr:DUF2069 domain-containing protein [Marinobacterium sediminicola]ULG70441.1 DUF2069 domain-containing protein [Marinobacterium sediminicola]SMR69323.1 Uncharacterized membrane protein [Marinobacterium sediminicola]
MQSLAAKTHLSRALVLFSYFGLLLLFSLWYLWLAPSQGDNPWVIWLVHLLPLLAFAPVVIKGKPRGHAWLCFVLLLYFLEAVIAAMLPPPTRWLGLIDCALLVTLFTSAMLYARWRSQLDRAQSTGTDA